MESSPVTIRDLRNRGGEVVDRAARGERVVITRAGTPVAVLTPVPLAGASAEALVARRRHLPPVDPDRLRRDVDAVIDSAL